MRPFDLFFQLNSKIDGRMFLSLPDDIHEEKATFLQFKKNALRTDQPTDERTDRRTDRPSYRDARTHLKTAQLSRWRNKVSSFRLRKLENVEPFCGIENPLLKNYAQQRRKHCFSVFRCVRISIRGLVRRSVGWSVGPSVMLS